MKKLGLLFLSWGLMVAAFDLGRRVERAHHTNLVIIQLHCFNGETWDRCRAGTDGTLFDAHGKVSKATIQLPQ